MMPQLTALACTLAVISVPSLAHAKPKAAALQRPDTIDDDVADRSASSVVAPGTRAMFATFSLAPALGLSSNTATQFKIAQTFGYHFGGDASGFALGAELQESFGGGAFALNVGPKAWYDFAVSRDYGVYIAPTVMMGLAYASVDGGYFYADSSAAGFDMQFGVEAKLVLADRGLVFFRPLTIDLAIGSQVAVRYDLVFGGGVTF